MLFRSAPMFDLRSADFGTPPWIGWKGLELFAEKALPHIKAMGKGAAEA